MLTTSLSGSRVSVPPREVKFPTEVIFSVRPSDLDEQGEARIADFAMSPHGDRIAVLFATSKAGDQRRLWLAQWELKTKRMIAKIRLEIPISAKAAVPSVALFHSSIHYSPDGTKIAALVGNELDCFESESLKTLYFVPWNSGDGSTPDMFAPLFAISGDGTTLVVLTGQFANQGGPGALRTYDFSNGVLKARWAAPGKLSNLSLSANGKQLLVTVPTQQEDIILFDSESGRMLRSFSSQQRGSGRSIVNAIFLPDGRFVAIKTGPHTVDALKVFDSSSGRTESELTYKKFAPTGDMWGSDADSTLAILSAWESGFMSRVREGGPSNARLMFFHLDGKGQPFCVLGPLPENRDKSIHESGFIRFSSDLGSVGLFSNGRISLYSTGECRTGGGN